MIKKVDHFVITTADINSTIAFYEKLGFTAHIANGRYQLFAGDFKINVHLLGQELHPHAKNVTVGSADFCFEIDSDIEQYAEQLKNSGLQFATPIVDRTGVRGAMRSIYLYDPNGNLIELSQYDR